MGRAIRVGVVAPCSVVPQVELGMGVDYLRNAGFEVVVHPQCAGESFTFAGTDAERAGAFAEMAWDASIDVVWSARGGYGATRVLPILEKMTAERGAPGKKLLVGYSDVTALHSFARERWGWATLHAPMPAAGNFCSLEPGEGLAILDYVKSGRATPPWAGKPLAFYGRQPGIDLVGRVYGGNLTVWNCLTGTRFAPPREAGRMLFFEDVDEAPYRLDRMVAQLIQSGGFEGVAAVILGDFTGCEDSGSEVLSADPAKDPKAPKKALRRVYSQAEALERVFSQVGELGIAVAYGLGVGHGPNFAPLPLGARYALHSSGRLELLEWEWGGVGEMV